MKGHRVLPLRTLLFMRLDKLLAEAGFGTRTEIKKALKAGIFRVNDAVIKKADYQVNPETDKIYYQGEPVIYKEFEYYLLNKPAGYVSATRDNVYPTVMELIPDTIKDNLAPVGRLDVDTEGLLLITNDGQLAHRLLSPKRHVDKVYYADIDGIVTDADVTAFSKGLDIGEDKPALPAKLTIIATNSDKNTSQVEVTLHEGKFHQVKRMFHAIGKEVTYLKRISMGSLHLEETLPVGACRALTEQEIKELKRI